MIFVINISKLTKTDRFDEEVREAYSDSLLVSEDWSTILTVCLSMKTESPLWKLNDPLNRESKFVHSSMTKIMKLMAFKSSIIS